MSLLETILERTGIKHLPKAQGEDGSRHFVRAVGYTTDFRRIEVLPRRDWNVEPMISELAKLLTLELKTPDGAMNLWKVQAAALAEISELRGAFCPVGVGMGKTLVSLLAPVVLESQNPLLLVPAKLRDKTLAELPTLRKHWKLHRGLRIHGYSELSLEKNAGLLESISPDCIILDEVHYLRHKSAGRTKRVIRYLKEHPEVACVSLSGTIANRSLKDWSHIVQWCLRDGSPVPSKWQELTEWAEALDADVPEGERFFPGALKRFCEGAETPREGFRRRLVQTPGVIATKENDLGSSLVILPVDLEIPTVVQEALKKLRNDWETPNGDMLTNAIDLWRHARELALGFFYRWIPAPPTEWMEARREWKKYVRETLKHNRRNLDTELQVWNESLKKSHKEFETWRDIKESFRPNSVAEWISDFAIFRAKEWLKQEPGICWVEHRAFGDRLAQKSGFVYFGAGDNFIQETKEEKVIASIQAHSEGKNLQRWSRNLVVAPPTSGKAWEQLCGRTHREGQQADEVTFEVFLHVQELKDCFERARADARYLEETYGNRQKLNYADIG